MFRVSPKQSYLQTRDRRPPGRPPTPRTRSHNKARRARIARRVRRGSGSVHVGSQVSIFVPWRLGRGMLSEVVGIIILIAIVPTMSSASGREKICIVGSGNWGSAIATVVGRNAGRLHFCHDEVTMWVRSATILSVFIAGLWLLTQCHWSGVRREDPDRRG